MIQYGQDNTYDVVREGYIRSGTSFGMERIWSIGRIRSMVIISLIVQDGTCEQVVKIL